MVATSEDKLSVDPDKRGRDIKSLSPKDSKDPSPSSLERPNKSRRLDKSKTAAPEEEDPLAKARLALAMFRKETEDDYKSDNEKNLDSASGGSEQAKPNETNGQHASDSAGSPRWQKSVRQPLISQDDDPSIL